MNSSNIWIYFFYAVGIISIVVTVVIVWLALRVVKSARKKRIYTPIVEGDGIEFNFPYTIVYFDVARSIVLLRYHYDEKNKYIVYSIKGVKKRGKAINLNPNINCQRVIFRKDDNTGDVIADYTVSAEHIDI